MAGVGFIFEEARWPVLLVDKTGIIRLVNQAAEMAFGLIIEGKTNLTDSIWPAENRLSFAQYYESLPTAAPEPVQIKFKLKDGTTRPFHALGYPLYSEGVRCLILQVLPVATQDLPAPQAGSSSQPEPPSPNVSSPEAAANQKQKLDCALQLIRTVVLDFNNALTSILGHTSLLLGKMDASHPWRNSLAEVEKSAEKAAEIANDLAAFSRQDRDARSMDAGNLNDLMRRTIELFQTPKHPHYNWSMRLENRLFAVHFDEAKMQQAFMKILDNAIQATSPGGAIGVQTNNLEVSSEWANGSVTLAPGNYVCIEFTDSGSGILPDVLPRIFEPFFTTKPNHRGLGLAWVYGIVTNHGGSVTVASQVGQGTVVRIYLPAIRRIVHDQVFDASELTGAETVLIVDDEDLLLTMGQMVLSTFGYNVLTANSGEKAIEMVAQSGGAIDLVITDMVMPTMSGRELMDQLRSLAPHVKIICSSGYVRPISHQESEIYLQKPFTSQELLRKVKQALISS
jgi:two-component system, cell cycle sensor histidine kinase and response regulator CckA